MWRVDDQDWQCLKRVGADCTADQREQLKKIIDVSFIFQNPQNESNFILERRNYP